MTPPTRADDGFSLVESMVAMTLTVTVIGVALGGFQDPDRPLAGDPVRCAGRFANWDSGHI